ncbi:MAG: peptidoglycan DD-metalloendopeptidase family protein [Gallionella sp.]|nr:peptidoglycan DD-metalloendopeptidase family protein [Gallionella sp.]
MTAVRKIAQRTLWSATSVAVLLAACGAPAPSGRKAPIVEYGSGVQQSTEDTTLVSPQRPAARPSETTGKIHIVQKGDTLYSIAFVNGVDYRDVAEWNDIKDPSAIQIGQQLKLNIPVDESVTQRVEVKPVVPLAPPKLGGIKNQPKVGRLAYSEDALAKADRMQEDVPQNASAAVAAKPQVINPAKDDGPEEAMEWGMPTNGKVIADFSESANRKGVDITGKRSQAIVASASGKVVYSGSGLRGYGKLIIIKHNKTFLSAYAHNDQILVKEGQSVSKGQKIAEMGNTDADQVKLHFEIRKLGKPVDPAKYLPLVKS